MSLHFTPSKDGRSRAAVRVTFRVGIDTLETAAAQLVWTRMVDEADQGNVGAEALRALAGEIAATLTRREVVASLRDCLQRSGYSMSDTLDDEWFDAAAEAARPRVAKLWPDLAKEGSE